ncbi:MAG: SRPBCC family protein [Rhodospirillaceae bacterium]
MRTLFVILALASATPATAAIVDAGATGMEIKHTVRITASPQKVWEALLQPAKWWSSAHTFSGAAVNLTLEPKVGGCWCETLPGGGGVMHMTVGFIAPPKSLVLHGGLGPFFDKGVAGAMTWSLSASGAETDLTLTYRVGGYIKDGFGELAQPVDDVLAEQIGGLKKLAETKP